MNRPCGLWKMSFSPAKNIALYVVVALCETPPPSSFSNLPPLMMKPLVKPLASVRSPTILFSEKMSPGFSTVPLINAAARPMLMLRYGRYGKVGREPARHVLDAELLRIRGGEGLPWRR